MAELMDALSAALMIAFIGFLVTLALLMLTLTVLVIRAEFGGVKEKPKKEIEKL